MRKMHYLGYDGTVEFSKDDNVFHGIILGIRGTVTFEADTLEALPKAFHESVEDYLQTCKEMGWLPDKPYQHVSKKSNEPRGSGTHV